MKLPLFILAACTLTACYNKASDTPVQEKPVARAGNETLYRSQLSEAVPKGLSEPDSIEFVRQYVNRWIDRKLIDQSAASALDMKEIEKRVDKYRQDLVIAEYRRICFEKTADTTFSDEQLTDYYKRHKELFEVARPMIKGIYLKVPDDASNLREIKRLLNLGGKADIDKLEGLVAGTAIHYDYFLDKWVEWRQIEQLIPTRFEEEPMQTFMGRKTLDISLGGFTYLLKVKEYLPAGSTLPYEHAIPRIRQRLTDRERMNYEATFMQRMRKDAEKNGQVEINL